MFHRPVIKGEVLIRPVSEEDGTGTGGPQVELPQWSGVGVNGKYPTRPLGGLGNLYRQVGRLVENRRPVGPTVPSKVVLIREPGHTEP